MPGSDADEHPDRGREHLEVIRETIDRNSERDWDYYRENYTFTLLDEGRVRVSSIIDTESVDSPIVTEVDHVVTIDAGTPVTCNCHIARRPIDRKPCRHMRAVDAHPRL
ncbi:hypothetical protein ACFQGT_10595 [Natrialbaceae archaeon GCM10025810]|uniref:hypothetical protein n=1 Tax=Halovalidus salilacus TaxID=3075124 RepID=UPI00360C1BA4